MNINELMNGLEIIDHKNARALEVSGVAYHSGKVAPGNVFVCVKGYLTDGHKYLKQAIGNGATAAVVEEFQEDVEIPQYLVKDSRIALASMGSAFYGYPSRKMKMIGITATNGKTTTSYMVNSIFEAMGLRTGLIGTVMIKNHDHHIAADLTTPESLDLQGYLAEMVENDVTHVTMEVSSSALELNRVYGVNYDIVAFNNLSREHIDMHGSFEEYFSAKSSLIRNVSETSTAILNLDCPYASSLITETKAQVITYGLKEHSGHILCKDLDLTTGRGRFTIEVAKAFKVGDIHCPELKFDVELAVPGLHSVYNALAAVAIGLASGAPVDAIQRGLKQFKGVERRFEFIYEGDFIIIDDHFANAGNIDVTLRTLDYMKYNNLQLVYAIRGNRGPIVNRENAETIAKWSKILGFSVVIATKSVRHTTSKELVTDEEVSVFLEVMNDAGLVVHLHDGLAEAIAEGLSKAEHDDLVLLAGCQGMDFGAEVALHQLIELIPGVNKEEVLEPLRTRVCGISNDFL
jgi:UDP-N-acetylmuramoyl-L-alanyl-D-glutamate--2,6-diaminopimelate ligase